MVSDNITLAQALELIRPLAGRQYVSIDINVVDAYDLRGHHKTEVDYTIYVAGTGSEPAWAHESGSTLADAVSAAIAKLRPLPDEPLTVADAALAEC